MFMTLKEAHERQNRFWNAVLIDSPYQKNHQIYRLLTLHRRMNERVKTEIARDDFYLSVAVSDEFPDDHTLPFEFEELPVEYRRSEIQHASEVMPAGV